MGLIIRLFTLWSVLTWFCCVALSATFGFDFTSCNCSGPVSEWWLYPYDAFITFWRDVHNFFMSVLKIISDESVFCCCFHSGIWTLYHDTVLVRFGWSKNSWRCWLYDYMITVFPMLWQRKKSRNMFMFWYSVVACFKFSFALWKN